MEVEELEPSPDHRSAVAVGVVPIEQGEDGVGRRGEVVEHEGETAAGLLIVPGPGEKHGHFDPADLIGGAARGHRRPEILQGPSEALKVEVLRADRLVGTGDLIACIDACLVPGHATLLGLSVALGQPHPGETRVVGATGPLLTPQVIDHRLRSDGRQMWRAGGCDVELGDTRVAESDHADAVAEHEVLAGHRLDDVEAVGCLGGTEDVEDAPRTAGAADVHTNDGKSEQGGQQGARLGGVGVRRAIAGVLNHRWPWTGAIQVLVGEPNHRRQQHVVAHRQVAETLGERLVVERRVGVVIDRHHPNQVADPGLGGTAGVARHHPILAGLQRVATADGGLQGV